jgi:hypothetical protein
MDAKKFLLGTIVGGIVMFIAGYVLYDLLLGKFFAANVGSATGVMREPLMFWAIGVGCLAEAALITYALGARGGAGAGITVGAIVGFLMALSVDFIMYGSSNVSNLTATLVDPLVAAVVGAIVGAAIGLVAGKPKPA